jgi:hypothetical protein
MKKQRGEAAFYAAGNFPQTSPFDKNERKPSDPWKSSQHGKISHEWS